MSKHTPGPWIADSVNTQDDAVTAVWQNDGRSDYYLRTSQVCECFWDSGEDLDIGDNRPVSLAEAEANAKLIAAAPELLEACKTLAEWFKRENEGFPNAGEVRKTAEGEAAWRQWWEENMRLCDLAKTQADAAIAKATA